MGWISETTEMLSKRLIDPAVELGAKLMGRTTRDAAAKGLEKVEPTMAKTEAKADDALKSSYDAAGSTAKKKGTSIDEQKAMQDRLDKAAGKDAAKTAEKEVGKDAAEKEIKTTAPKTADEIFKEAGGKRLGWIEARGFAKSSKANYSYADKLRDLYEGGRPDWANRVIAEMRFKGIPPDTYTNIMQEAHIPQSVKNEVKRFHMVHVKTLNPVEKGIEAVASTTNYLGSRAVEAVTNPISAVSTAWDLFAAQWRVPIGAVKLAKNNLGKTAIGGAAVVSAAAAADHAMGGAISTTAGTAINKTVGAYKAVDGVVLNGAYGVGTTALGLVTSKSAEEAAKMAGDGAIDAAEKVPSFTNKFFSAMLGEPLIDYVERNPALGLFLPKSISIPLKADKIRRDAKGQNMPEQKVDETGTTPPAAAPAAGASAPDKSPEQLAEDNLSEEEKGAYAKITDPAERKKFIGNKVTQLMKNGKGLAQQGKDLAAQGVGAVEDALSEGEMKKIGDLAKKGGFMGLLGGLIGFMSGGTKGAKIMNALGLGFIFGMLGDMLGIPHSLNFGSGRAGYNRRMSQMDQVQQNFFDNMNPGARGARMNGTGPVGALTPIAAGGQMVMTPQAAVYVPAKNGMNGTGPVGALTPVNGGPQPVSAAQQVSNTPIQTTVNPKDEIGYEAMIQKAAQNNEWANNKVAQVTKVDGVPTYNYPAAAPTPAPAPAAGAKVSNVNGTPTYSYDAGTPNPNITDDSRQKAKQYVIQNPELSMN